MSKLLIYEWNSIGKYQHKHKHIEQYLKSYWWYQRDHKEKGRLATYKERGWW